MAATLTTVREMIDTAFLNDCTTVHMKQIQMILFILARQLRLLERRVYIYIHENELGEVVSQKEFIVFEVKVVGRKPDDMQRKTKFSKHRTVSLESSSSSIIFEKMKKPRRPGKKQDYDKGKVLVVQVTSAKHGAGWIKEHRNRGTTGAELDESTLGSSNYSASSEASYRSSKYAKPTKPSKPVKTEQGGEVTNTAINTARASQMFTTTSQIAPRINRVKIDQISQPIESIATIEQYLKLVDRIEALQKKYSQEREKGDEEERAMGKQMKNKYDLSDSRAMVQLATRLDKVETLIDKSLMQLTAIVKDLGLEEDLSEYLEDIHMLKSDKSLAKILSQMGKSDAVHNRKISYASMGLQTESHGASDGKSQVSIGQKLEYLKPSQLSSLSLNKGSNVASNRRLDMKELVKAGEADMKLILRQALALEPDDLVNFDHLKALALDLYETVHAQFDPDIKRAAYTSKLSLMTSNQISNAIKKLCPIYTTLDDVEDTAYDFAERIEEYNTNIINLITEYQEGLNEMQFDLERGLDNLSEAMASRPGDPEAVFELNQKLTALVQDLRNFEYLQSDLSINQDEYGNKLRDLLNRIKDIKDVKVNRDEVSEQISMKVGLETLNGYVLATTFHAVVGDLQTRISLMYQQINNKEALWQQNLNDLTRRLQERAGKDQVEFLGNDVQDKCETLHDRANLYINIAGPKLKPEIKKKYLENPCLICGKPMIDEISLDLNIDIKLTNKRPIGAEKSEIDAASKLPKEDGDHVREHVICIPGTPIPHTIDSRSAICTKICGGVPEKDPKSKLAEVLFTRNLDMKPKKKKILRFVKPCIPCNDSKVCECGAEKSVACTCENIPEPKESRTSKASAAKIVNLEMKIE